MNLKPLNLILLSCITLFFTKQTRAQEPVTSELYKTIAALDSRFFNAYNTCDLKTARELVSDSLEFYHDQGGLTTKPEEVINGIKNNICGKVKRELVPGTLQVFILKGFGAIESGEHYFYNTVSGNKGDLSKPVGRARFFHIWRQLNGRWQMTRIISYDHVPLD